ncbi:hypothetical protein L873DRAFT_1817203 [Choiromyces venosus 120613-1]|uniref:Uncharacterized protein n=1 Tax=Choiromyces venosus 120613-1 TaxID=1336337 RepID=A0A3N4J606_9PEZI|nr:hypothetical protein L873DRAFT_1817203 [Choiromyces venosus 120613-1]
MSAEGRQTGADSASGEAHVKPGRDRKSYLLPILSSALQTVLYACVHYIHILYLLPEGRKELREVGKEYRTELQKKSIC